MITKYTGLPYDFRRYNCWHHVRTVRSEAGLDTPLFDVISPRDIADAFDRGHDDPKGLRRVSAPEDLDIVLLGRKHGNRTIWHAGVYYQGMVSHCSLGAGQVRCESLSDLRDHYTEVEFWH